MSDANPSTSETTNSRRTEWENIGPTSEYGQRTHVQLHKRRITILRIGDKTHAIDTTCYHAGGPLTDGALKSVAGRTCLRCPWHSYLIDVNTGEGLYMDLNRKYQSKGVRQRVHEVEEREGCLWVRLLENGEVASDVYAFRRRFGDTEEEDGVKQFPLDW